MRERVRARGGRAVWRIGLFAAVTGIALPVASAGADDKPHSPSLTVWGDGEANAAPDLAEVDVGVITQAKTAADALHANSAAMDKLLRTVSAQGIAATDVLTIAFDVAPQFEQRSPQAPSQRPPAIAGYQVTNEVHVKVRQVAKLGAVLDAIVAAGANQVQGVRFSQASPDKVLDRARTDAMADARRKAELLARTAGVRLGSVISVDEHAAGMEPPPGPRPMMAARAESVPIASGEQTYHATVRITWAIDGATPPSPTR